MNQEIERLLRDNIRRLEPYSCARDEFKGTARVMLDANENPFNAPINRYPDPLQWQVKTELAKVKGIGADHIFLGVGSDECIDICYRVFCEPRIDNIVAMAPSYGMYEVCADINDVNYRKVPLNADFSLDTDAMLAAADTNTKLMWICSPNNPTGNSFPFSDIERLYNGFSGMIVVDEAYIDFSSRPSAKAHIDDMPRLVVLQTFSKAWGNAGARMGIAFAHPDIIGVFNKVKYPYNISTLAQSHMLDMLAKADTVKQWVATILDNRASLLHQLASVGCITHIYPTDANFILVATIDADDIYRYLCSDGIIVRNRNRVRLCEGCLRITVGTADENAELIAALHRYDNQDKQ